MDTYSEPISRWTLDHLPARITEALDSLAAFGQLAADMSHRLAALPARPDHVPPPTCRRLLVDLGFWGSALVRLALVHGRTDAVLDSTTAGDLSFRHYYAGLAVQSASGHPPWQSFTSIISWNVPTVEVRLDGDLHSRSEGIFDGPRVRTWTGTASEVMLWELFKVGAALGSAANGSLDPIVSGTVSALSEESLSRLLASHSFLRSFRQRMATFSRGQDPRGEFSVDVFMNQIRQFGVPWESKAEAPSGPHEVESLARDAIFGMPQTRHKQWVRARSGSMMSAEGKRLDQAADAPTLAEVIQRSMAKPQPFDDLTVSVLVAAHDIYEERRKLSAAHYGMARKMLYRPQREQSSDRAGMPTTTLAVDNSQGITGMSENDVQGFDHARRVNPLENVLAALPSDEISHARSLIQKSLYTHSVSVTLRYSGTATSCAQA
ncbi:hypothetical protein ACFY2R_06775 [Micromonospora olivasterospora]|uniref:Uncharacterized protein n=2 Tax=Micromonospora olivasterospora TaxID=1880 RepID=A0A562I674_MICOL|nr:hypothetical protein [Micromonospora olivasterospora]TWH66462.1 hypothetical protein JD77_01416 [Micromonospora olivasterospora]